MVDGSQARLADVPASRDDKLARILRRIAHVSQLRVPSLTERLYITPSTICNLKCRFCAYPKTSIPRQIMPDALFAEVVDKACEYGFTRFGLTPILGEAFIDPRFLDKLELLERHRGVAGFSFCTNLTVLSRPARDRLRRLTKLGWLSVSVYGHDEDTFAAITRARPELFHTVLRNLESLSDWPDVAARVEVRLRTAASFRPEDCHPRLRELLEDLEQRRVRVRIPHDRFSNWGGLITSGDLRSLDIHLKPQTSKGSIPCAFLFHKHTVLPDGRLNACYADDGNATMVIGDLSRERFEQIYSLDNDRYIDLLLSHCEARFSDVCRACTGYRGIQEHRQEHELCEEPFSTVAEFFANLGRSPC